MPESFREKRRKELQSSQTMPNDGMTYRERRKAELGSGQWSANSENAMRAGSAKAREQAESGQREKNKKAAEDTARKAGDPRQKLADMTSGRLPEKIALPIPQRANPVNPLAKIVKQKETNEQQAVEWDKRHAQELATAPKRLKSLLPSQDQRDIQKSPSVLSKNFIAEGKAIRDAKDPKNPILKFIKDNTVDALGEGFDRLQVKTSIGRGASRFGQSAGKMQGVDTQAAGGAPILSTGSKFADKTVDIAGKVAGLVVDPNIPIQGVASLQGIGTVLKGAAYKAGMPSLRGIAKDTAEQVASKQMKAIDTVARESLPANISRPVAPVKKDPTKLDELVATKGFKETTPETIAQTYNGKVWYHGTGTDKLTAESLDPFAGSHESLFGQGVYLTDNPKIAQGYANSRGKRGTPTIYESNVSVGRVLDLEKPVPPEVYKALDKTVKPLDYLYEHEIGDPDYFTNLIRTEAEKGATTEDIITKLRQEVKEFSHTAQIPTSEFVNDFQELAINLKQAGYDGITHTGGHRTGKDPHRVLILLDPQNVHGAEVGSRQVTKFDRYSPPVESNVMRVNGVKGAAETFREKRLRELAEPEVAVSTPEAPPSKYANERAQLPTSKATAHVIESTPEINPPSSAPVKQNWFTALFGDKGVGVSAVSSKQRLKTKPLTSEEVIVKRPIREDKNGLIDSATAEMKAQYYNHVDALDPMKHAGNNVYEAAMDSGRANQIANNIVGKDFVTPEGVRIGDGMEALFKKVPRGQDKKFIDYLILRDAEARIPRGERVYDESIQVPNPENPLEHIPLNSEIAVRSRRELMERQFPWMATLGKEWNQFTDNLSEIYGVKEGILSKEAKAAMQQLRPDYIKMMREFTRAEKPGRKLLGHSSNSTFSGLKAPIKRVSPTGSARNIVDPRRTMAEYVGAMVNNAMRNRAGKALVQNLTNDPEGMAGVARIVPETAEATKKSMDEINKILQEDGLDGLMEKLNGEFEMAFKKSGQKGGKDNLITVMVDGHPVKVEILNPEVALAFQGMSPQQVGIVTGIAQKLSNAVKRSATGPLAPLFAAKSVTVDLATSLVQSDNAARFIPDYFHAVFSSIGDKLGIPGLRNMAKEFRLAGGGYSAALRGERALNKTVKNLDRLPILSPKNLGRQAMRWNPVTLSFKVGEGISDIFENAPRMAAAKGKLRSLGGDKTQGNVRQAMKASREITVNYTRKGRYSNEIEAWAPYSNAAVQGVYRVFNQFKHKPIKTVAAVTILAVMPKMYEYAQFHDDPDYQNLPARERFRNLIISKNSDGSFNKIPMEPTYNSIGEMTIETLRYFKDQDPEAFKGSMDALSNAWLPPIPSGGLQGITQGGGIDQSIKGLFSSSSIGPLYSMGANQSFTGAPIDSMKVQDRSPQNRYDERTSKVAKWLGEKLSYSPMKVDYIMRQYGGDASRLLLPLTSEIGAGTPRNTLLRNFIVDPVFTNNLTNDYYQGKELISRAYRDNQEVDAALPKWYSEELKKYVTSTARGSVSKQLSALSDEKKAIQTKLGLTAESKAQQLREVQRKINELYLEVNTRMEQAGVPLMRR